MAGKVLFQRDGGSSVKNAGAVLTCLRFSTNRGGTHRISLNRLPSIEAGATFRGRQSAIGSDQFRSRDQLFDAFELPPLPGSQHLPVQFVIKTTGSFDKRNEIAQRFLEARWTDLKIDSPEAVVENDRDKAAQLGPKMSDVGNSDLPEHRSAIKLPYRQSLRKRQRRAHRLFAPRQG